MTCGSNIIEKVHKRTAADGNTMTSRLIWCSALVCLSLASVVSAENHCSEHRYEHSLNTHHLQFTKEIPDREYGVLRQFKSLHCCGKGYRSIEWFKNNKPHPWSKDVSSFIVYPEAANQTIYSPRLEENDIGNYTCILRNETHAIKHEIELRLQDNKPDNPMPTFRPKDMMMGVGESARFYCEAYVGNLYLPDAANEIVWSQMFDDHPHNVTDSVQVNVTREEGQIIGSYLSIPNIKAHHYGRYRCQIMSGNSAQKLNLSVLLSPVEVTAITDSQLSALVYIMATLLFVLVLLFAWICRTVQQRTAGKQDSRCSAQFIEEHESVSEHPAPAGRCWHAAGATHPTPTEGYSVCVRATAPLLAGLRIEETELSFASLEPGGRNGELCSVLVRVSVDIQSPSKVSRRACAQAVQH